VPPATTEGSPEKRRTPSLVRVAVLLAVVAAVVIATRLLPVGRWLLDFVAWIRGAGTPGMLLFVVGYAIAIPLLLPGALLTLGAGFAYGVALGVPLVWIGASMGATAAFVLGRTLARRWIAARAADNPRFAAIDRAVASQGLRIVLLSRLSPLFPFNFLNYAFALTRVSLRDYVLGTVVGILPGTTMYVYLGSLVTSLTELSAGRRSGGTAEHVFYFAGLVVTVAVTAYVTVIARRALAQATDGGEDAPGSKQVVARPLILPDDEHNRALAAQVHPPGRRNPTPAGRYNLVVVGGGTAGLVSAVGAAGLGAKVALIERHLLGGDCLNVGCVPSKALVRAGRAAAIARDAGRFGVRTGAVSVDFAAVMERMRRLRARLAPTDGVPRLESLGIDVYLGDGRFTGPDTIEVDGQRLEFARAVIASGARPAAPDIPGLADVAYLTNETVFELTTLPRRFAVVGAGPIGCEMAQTFRRFGAEVTLLEAGARVLPRDEPEAAAVIERRLAAEGVRLLLGATVRRAAHRTGSIELTLEAGGETQSVTCDAVLVGVGRAPNVEHLGLDAAGVAHDGSGVHVDDHLLTSNSRIYAAGDIASRHKFTHVADALARIVVQNALFLGRRKASALLVPWCTYTSPEVAHVGLSPHEAAARGVAVTTLRLSLEDLDRAVLDGETDGFLHIHLRPGTDRIVGATLVAEHAGDMISEITLAMAGGIGLGRIASVIHPYPTQAEIVRKAGDAYNRTRLTPTVKRLFSWWLGVRR